MLSFTRGQPIAKIIGGKYEGKIVRLYIDAVDKTEKMQKEKEEKADIESSDPNEYLTSDFIKNLFNKNKRISLQQMQQIKKALEEKADKMEDDNLDSIFKKVKDELTNKTKTELILHDGMIQPLVKDDMDEENRKKLLKNKNRDDIEYKAERMYITAPSEAGKSTYISKYLEEYKKKYPKKKIFLFSDIESDPVLDKLGTRRIKMDEELYEKPIQPHELKNSLVIFDDIDAIADKKLSKAVQALRDEIYTRGRHDNISVISTAHLLSNGIETKKVLTNSTSITIFPHSGDSFEYFLKRYAGLNIKQINRILSLPSRWVTIVKGYPKYVMYSSGIYLL